MKYDVAITKAGGIVVEANSPEEAITKVYEMRNDEIEATAQLTGWEASDADELKDEADREICFNTTEHGCIWGELTDAYTLNAIAQNNGFLKSDLTYMGFIETCDTKCTYMFFRSEKRNSNYMVLFQQDGGE